jgi:hypothetical protein
MARRGGRRYGNKPRYKHIKKSTTFSIPASGLNLGPAAAPGLTEPTNDGFNYQVLPQPQGWNPGVVTDPVPYSNEFEALPPPATAKTKTTFRRSLVTHIQPGKATGFIYSGQIAPDSSITVGAVADDAVSTLARVSFGLIHRRCLDSNLPTMNGETWYQTSNIGPQVLPTRSVFTDVIDAETELIAYYPGFVSIGRGVCEIFRFQDRVKTSRTFETGDSLLALVDNANSGFVGVRVTLAITYFYRTN